jgi:hypothetical protein
MKLYHALANVPPWGPCAELEQIDGALQDHGSIALPSLKLGAFALESDGQHYTRAAFQRFADHLASSLGHLAYPLIVSDSTIDWHNYDSEWECTEWASNVVRGAFSGRCVVDAVCGSGFVARASHNEHFYPRLSRHLRVNKDITDVVLLGGWNDVHRTADACRCIQRLASLVHCYPSV